MKLFFITYGNDLIGYYSKIMANTYGEARAIAYEGTAGGMYSFMYEGEEELNSQILKYNLKEIEIQPMRIG